MRQNREMRLAKDADAEGLVREDEWIDALDSENNRSSNYVDDTAMAMDEDDDDEARLADEIARAEEAEMAALLELAGEELDGGGAQAQSRQLRPQQCSGTRRSFDDDDGEDYDSLFMDYLSSQQQDDMSMAMSQSHSQDVEMT